MATDKEDIQKFIDLINGIPQEVADQINNDHKGYLYELPDKELAQKLEALAAGVFMNANASGGNYDNADIMKELADEGDWSIGPGETDSFGWLSGVVYTPKGKVVFG